MYYLVCIADKCLRQIIVRLGRANFISGSVGGREFSRDVEFAFKRCPTQRLPYQRSNVSAFNASIFSVEQIVFSLANLRPGVPHSFPAPKFVRLNYCEQSWSARVRSRDRVPLICLSSVVSLFVNYKYLLLAWEFSSKVAARDSRVTK